MKWKEEGEAMDERRGEREEKLQGRCEVGAGWRREEGGDEEVERMTDNEGELKIVRYRVDIIMRGWRGD